MMYDTGFTTDALDAAALEVDRPQPVWMTLNQARERSFTGEVIFEDDPEVLVYFDNGVAYFAERAGDGPLGQRLLDAGLVDAVQLERGTVRIGEIEHLGRLFDRDPSVERDAVIVMTETHTEELIADLANRVVTTARVTAYRHHPSGIHRWFVAPRDQVAVSRPPSAVAQLDSSVLDELPGLPYGLDDDELMIEWDDDLADIDLLEPEESSDTPETPEVVQAVLLENDEPVGSVDTAEPDAADIDDLVSDEVGEFAVVDVADATDGSDLDSFELVFDPEALELSLGVAEFTDDVDVDAEIEAAVDVDLDPGADAELVDELADGIVEVEVETIDDLAEPEVAPVDLFESSATITDVDEVEPAAGPLEDVTDFRFSVVWPDGSEELAEPPLADPTPSDEPGGDAPSVAEAGATVTESDDGELHFSMPPLALSDEPEQADAEVPDDVADAVRRAIAAIESASVGAPAEASTTSSGFGGFAPPTPDMRAEALFGQGAEADPSIGSEAEAAAGDDAAGDHGDRNSALRRLIGSLRRKDH